MTARLLTGDALLLMREMPADFFDSIVTDAPYGMSDPPDIVEVLRRWLPEDPRIVSAIVDLLRIRATARANFFWHHIAEHTTSALLKLIAVVRDSRSAYKHGKSGFMGAAWDSFVPGPQVWTEALRVAKPGAHALVFASTRTVDLMGISCRLGGWEVRDTLHWCQWQGMPHGHNVSKGIDALAGAERRVVGKHSNPAGNKAGGTSLNMSVVGMPRDVDITAPATADAVKWDGWNTELKPAVEPVLLLRKPLSESTIARNVLRWGTGALNIDGSRIPKGSSIWPGPDEYKGVNADGTFRRSGKSSGAACIEVGAGEGRPHALGRYPANLIHFKKPSRKEKEAGCEGLPMHYSSKGAAAGERGGVLRRCPEHGEPIPSSSNTYGCGCSKVFDKAMPHNLKGRRNHHPTVKPIALMRYLCRLVTPPRGDILDMFGGSGTTAIGASLGGFDVTLCELDAAFVDISRARIKHWVPAQKVEGGTDPEPTGQQTTLFG